MDSSTYGPSEERARILRMVESGDLSAAEAVSLLDRLSGQAAAGAAPEPLQPEEYTDAYAQAPLPPAPPEPPRRSANGAPQWLRVRVTDLNSGRSKVSVNIPFKLASWGLRVGSHFSPHVEGVDLAELSRMLNEDGAQGMLVDVVDEEDGDHVQVFVE